MGLKEKMTLEKFEEACEAVGQVTLDTSLIYSDYFSERTGGKVYLKPENRQRTGAYKVRGAYYKISTLSDEHPRAITRRAWLTRQRDSARRQSL